MIKNKAPESKLAHKYLDGLKGIEIGGGLHNPFGLDAKNIDITDSEKDIFKKEEIEVSGNKLAIDILASGDKLPLGDCSQDFVVNSHVLEHFPDPIKALKEWYRVTKKGGYIFLIIPHKERMFDRNRLRTKLSELIERHKGSVSAKKVNGHYSVWVTEDLIELIDYLGWNIIDFQDVDDKIGNGFTVVVKKGEINKNIKLCVEEKIEDLRALRKQKGSESRIIQLWRNTKKEFLKNGVKGVFRRIKNFKKWENQ